MASLLDDLKREIERGHVTVVVGAGVSIAHTLRVQATSSNRPGSVKRVLHRLLVEAFLAQGLEIPRNCQGRPQPEEHMKTIQSVVRGINKELAPQFEQKLRSYLATQDREWLVEQIIRLTMDVHTLRETDRKLLQEGKARLRQERVVRLRALALDEQKLGEFIARYKGYTRERLIAEGHLRADAPVKGTALLTEAHRTQEGTKLLTLAKDVLFALLFGEKEDCNCSFQRVQEELLTMTLPLHKFAPLDFMKASTELNAHGDWQDPEMVSNDSHEADVLLQVEYGDMEGKKLGAGLLAALGLINNLEVNEQILYARIQSVERSTLVG